VTIKEVLSIKLTEEEIAEAVLLFKGRDDQHWKFVHTDSDDELYTPRFTFEKVKLNIK